MTQNTDIPQQPPAHPFRTWGMWAVLIGALAVILVFMQFVLPTLTHHPSASARVGEMAGEIRRAAWRSFLGLPRPAPDPQPVSLTHVMTKSLALAAPILGVVAVVLSLISGLLRENRRYAVYAVALGGTAILFQFFWWLALLIVGMLLLTAIIQNMGDIFGF